MKTKTSKTHKASSKSSTTGDKASKTRSKASKAPGFTARKKLIVGGGKSVDSNATMRPTERDILFLISHPLPPTINDRILIGITEGFTPRVCAALQKPEPRTFFGSRSKPDQIVDDTTIATEGNAVAARLQHGAEQARQIAAPRNVRLQEQGGVVMRDIDEFVTEHPQFADELADLAAYWTATFPGGGGKTKDSGTSGDKNSTGSDKNSTGGDKAPAVGGIAGETKSGT